MTDKEAKGNLMYALKWNDMPEKEALKIAIKKLDNEDVLDKIRAEIDAIYKEDMECDGCSDMGMVLDIIDRHTGK